MADQPTACTGDSGDIGGVLATDRRRMGRGRGDSVTAIGLWCNTSAERPRGGLCSPEKRGLRGTGQVSITSQKPRTRAYRSGRDHAGAVAGASRSTRRSARCARTIARTRCSPARCAGHAGGTSAASAGLASARKLVQGSEAFPNPAGRGNENTQSRSSGAAADIRRPPGCRC